MASILDELDDRCPQCGVLVWDEQCRGCNQVREAPPHADKPDHDGLPRIRGW